MRGASARQQTNRPQRMARLRRRKLPMNCRALFSQERESAKARHASREIVRARRQAACRSASRAPIGLSAITSSGPVTGKAATGAPQASASSCTTPNVSVRLGNTKTSAAAKWEARSAPFFSPRKRTAGYFFSSAAFRGPSPMTTVEPGRSSARNASRFFSTATRPMVMKIGRGRSSRTGLSGLNRSVSTPRVKKPSFVTPFS